MVWLSSLVMVFHAAVYILDVQKQGGNVLGAKILPS